MSLKNGQYFNTFRPNPVDDAIRSVDDLAHVVASKLRNLPPQTRRMTHRFSSRDKLVDPAHGCYNVINCDEVGDGVQVADGLLGPDQLKCGSRLALLHGVLRPRRLRTLDSTASVR